MNGKYKFFALFIFIYGGKPGYYLERKKQRAKKTVVDLMKTLALGNYIKKNSERLIMQYSVFLRCLKCCYVFRWKFVTVSLYDIHFQHKNGLKEYQIITKK